MPTEMQPSAEDSVFRSLVADYPQILPYQNSLVRLRECLVEFRIVVRDEVVSFMSALSGPVGFTGILIDTEDSSIGKNVQRHILQTLACIKKETENVSNLSPSIAVALKNFCQSEMLFVLDKNEFKNLAKNLNENKELEYKSEDIKQDREKLLKSIKLYLKISDHSK